MRKRDEQTKLGEENGYCWCCEGLIHFWRRSRGTRADSKRLSSRWKGLKSLNTAAACKFRSDGSQNNQKTRVNQKTIAVVVEVK